MRNSGFYDKTGALITFDSLGVSVFDLLNLDFKVELNNPDDLKECLLNLILTNQTMRINYLNYYYEWTDSYNEKTAISKFIKSLKSNSDKARKESEITSRVVAFRENLPKTDPNYKVISGLYKMLDDAYEKFLLYDFDIDIIYDYAKEISDLIELIKNKYNYNAKIDKNYQEWLNKLNDIQQRKGK